MQPRWRRKRWGRLPTSRQSCRRCVATWRCRICSAQLREGPERLPATVDLQLAAPGSRHTGCPNRAPLACRIARTDRRGARSADLRSGQAGSSVRTLAPAARPATALVSAVAASASGSVAATGSESCPWASSCDQCGEPWAVGSDVDVYDRDPTFGRRRIGSDRREVTFVRHRLQCGRCATGGGVHGGPDSLAARRRVRTRAGHAGS